MLTSFAIDPINHFLDLEIRIREQLKLFSGQRIRIQIFPIVEFCLSISDEGKLYFISNQSEADTTLSIPSWQLPQLLLSNKLELKFIKITENKSLGNEIINLIQQINFDHVFAQELSKIIGDILTNRVIRTNETVHQWFQKNSEQVTDSVLEFCTEEKNVFVKSTAYREWTEQIDKLKHSIDQLEARINQLTSQSAYK